MKLLPLLLISALLLAQKPAETWTLTFADEFNGTDVDLARWAPHDPWGQVRDRQLQAWSPASAEVSGGQLHLIARRTAEDSPVRYDGQNREYVSGIVTTFGTFAQTYGRFEIRCRVPAARGLRAGFSLLPVPLGPLPEIDVFRVAGDAPAQISFGNHWGTGQTDRSYGDAFPGPDLSSGFHTIAVEWDAEKIVWFVDGREKFRSVDGVPHQRMYLLLELAVGGRRGLLPNGSTVLPASFDVDYIRVYRHGAAAKP